MSYIFRGKRKNKKTNKWQFWLGMIFIAMVVIFFGKINWQVHQKGKQLTIKVDQLRSKVNLLQEKKDKLEKDIEDVNKVDYLEKVGREELNLQKAGEKAIAFIASPKKTIQETPPQLSGWQKLIRTLKNWFTFKRQ